MIPTAYRSTALALTLASVVTSDAVAQTTPKLSPAAVIETGKFRFYETKQMQGEETYELKRAADGSLETTTKIDLPYMGEEEKPSLRATLQTQADLTPIKFQIQGTRPLGIAINTQIAVHGNAATITLDRTPANARGREVTVPKNFFALVVTFRSRWK